MSGDTRAGGPKIRAPAPGILTYLVGRARRLLSVCPMTHAGSQYLQYVITAKAPNGVIQQTRVRAASAVVLAKAWLAAGHTDVRIVDPLGKALHPEGYRMAIMKGGKPYR